MAVTNSFDNVQEFANKTRIASIVPAIGAELFKAEFGFIPGPQLGLAALAMYNALSAVPDAGCIVATCDMIRYMENAISNVHRLNNDKKQHHITHTPNDMLDLAVTLGWMESDGEMMKLSEKWIKFTSMSQALSPKTSPINQAERRVNQVKGNKFRQPKLFKQALKNLEDTGYHVHYRMGEAVSKVIERFRRENSMNSKAKMFSLLEKEMYVHKGSEMLVGLPELYSEYFADSRGRLYHAACFGPNPQSGDMARAYYSHNVENWVEKGTEAYEIFMTELADVAGKGSKWLQPDILRIAATKPESALWKFCQKEEQGDKDLPKKPLTYIRMAFDWLEFEENGKCDSRLGFGEDAKCSGTQILALLAGDKHMLEATGFRTTAGKSEDPYVICLANLKKLLKVSHLRHYISTQKMEEVLTRDFSKVPYMAVQYGCGVKALTENSDFIAALEKMGVPKEHYVDFIKTTIAAVRMTLGKRINTMVEAIQSAVSMKLLETGSQYFSYQHIDGFTVLKPCFSKLEISQPFQVRFSPSLNLNFGNIKDNVPWQVRGNEADGEEFVRTFVVNEVQGVDALIARTVSAKARNAGLRAYTSIHDCFRTCLADAPKLHKVICEAYEEIFLNNNLLKHLSEQLGGTINYHSEQLLTKEMIYSEHSYFFTYH
ncbi:DNA-directed RNA polymerase [Lelliottia wanjuensis]|uniref:DNA-directed RNA polymerase C-terminal domain-containing protein n=1 Tax=Lelliottia wanjuensis TaxID=3050585 RepID=A0AAP4LDL0_9ENTR|nr:MULTISPECIES: DNA-directed RNA polymerase [unclassified Lelliottia]MDK9366436.1 hypothetical protein [Lelliottia sp. V106_12]MDK9618695.1 hypothetical protein [Lelliottia sp. V106_9]